MGRINENNNYNVLRFIFCGMIFFFLFFGAAIDAQVARVHWLYVSKAGGAWLWDSAPNEHYYFKPRRILHLPTRAKFRIRKILTDDNEKLLGYWGSYYSKQHRYDGWMEATSLAQTKRKLQGQGSLPDRFIGLLYKFSTEMESSEPIPKRFWVNNGRHVWQVSFLPPYTPPTLVQHLLYAAFGGASVFKKQIEYLKNYNIDGFAANRYKVYRALNKLVLQQYGLPLVKEEKDCGPTQKPGSVCFRYYNPEAIQRIFSKEYRPSTQNFLGVSFGFVYKIFFRNWVRHLVDRSAILLAERKLLNEQAQDWYIALHTSGDGDFDEYVYLMEAAQNYDTFDDDTSDLHLLSFFYRRQIDGTLDLIIQLAIQVLQDYDPTAAEKLIEAHKGRRVTSALLEALKQYDLSDENELSQGSRCTKKLLQFIRLDSPPQAGKQSDAELCTLLYKMHTVLKDTPVAQEDSFGIQTVPNIEQLDYYYEKSNFRELQTILSWPVLRSLTLRFDSLPTKHDLSLLQKAPNHIKISIVISDLNTPVAKGLSEIPQLRSLSLVGKKINGSALAASQLSQLQYLYIKHPSQLSSKAWQGIGQMQSLKGLDLSSDAFDFKLAAPFIARLHNLIYLKLPNDYYWHMEEEDLRFLSGLKKLQSLNIKIRRLSHKGFSYLSSLCELRELKVYATTSQKDLLKNLPCQSQNKLVILHLRLNSGRSYIDLGYLKRFVHLQELLLHTRTDQQGLDAIASLRHLKRLNFQYYLHQDKGLRFLSNLKELRELHIKVHGWISGRGLKYLRNSKKMELLYFNAYLLDDSLPHLRYFFRNFHELKKIYLYAYIAKYIQKNVPESVYLKQIQPYQTNIAWKEYSYADTLESKEALWQH